MTTLRLLAIGFIFLCTAVAWSILGGTVVDRTGERDGRLSQEVAQLWGGHHVQLAPGAVRRPRRSRRRSRSRTPGAVTTTRTVKRTVVDRCPSRRSSSRVRVDLGLEHRQKGLLWYDTYAVAFQAEYRFVNPDAVEREVIVQFAFPSNEAIYDAFVVSLNGREAPPATDFSNGVRPSSVSPPGEDRRCEVAYRSRGLGEWTYAFGSEGVAQVRDFELAWPPTSTGIDFPAGTMSPTGQGALRRGLGLAVGFESLVGGQEDRHRPAEPPEPGAARRAHHVLRAGLAAVLRDRDGDPRRPARAEPAPDELLLPGRGVLRVPPAAGLPGGPHERARAPSRSPPPSASSWS